MDNKQIKAVYTIVDKPGDKSFWVRIGTAFLNRDGSWNLKLDALPMNGSLQMRDPFPPRDERDHDAREGREGARNGQDRAERAFA